MAENKTFKTYVSPNGTALKFPDEAGQGMDAEQRMCYQNFINVLAQILVKYAGEVQSEKKSA